MSDKESEDRKNKIKEYLKKYRLEHKEQLNEARRKYYQTHKEQEREYKKKYYQKYYQTHKEQVRKCQQRYFKTHKEQLREYRRRYYRNYYQTHKEQIKEYNISYLKQVYSQQLARLEFQLRQYEVPPAPLLDKKVMLQNILANLDMIQNYVMTLDESVRSEVRKRMIKQLLEKAGEMPTAKIVYSYDLNVLKKLQKRLKEIDERQNKISAMLKRLAERHEELEGKLRLREAERAGYEVVLQQLGIKQYQSDAKLLRIEEEITNLKASQQLLDERQAKLTSELQRLAIERDKITNEINKISGA